MTTTPPALIVVAADGTPSSEGALRFAVRAAVSRRAALRIVHVNPMDVPVVPVRPILGFCPPSADASSELTAHARRVLERIAQEARVVAPDLAVTTTLVRGGRVGAIVDASADAALMVVGRETRHRLERVLTGATTAGVASRAQCPVVVVPADWRPRNGAEGGGTVVVGVRRVADVPGLMATAYAWASAWETSITVVHAWEMSDPYRDRVEARTHTEEWQSRGERLLDEALADWRERHPDVQVVTSVVHGHAASVLSAAAQAADLMVVRRAHEHRPFDHLGATVRALLLASPVPVEVVPAHPGSGSGSNREADLEDTGRSLSRPSLVGGDPE
jgi:nucleotide-binding universal stress UspA family protein